MKSQAQAQSLVVSRQSYSTLLVQYIIAPLLCLFGGFHTMDFIVGGLYTWPQMSRVIALTFAMVILSYEFVFKGNEEESTHVTGTRNQQGLKTLLYSCFLPYVAGVLLLLSLVIMFQ